MKTITPVLSIVISILLVLFYVQPRYVEVQAVQKEINEYTTAIEKYTEFKNKLQEKLALIQARSIEENNRLASIAPTNLNKTRLLVNLESMAKSQNMLFGNVTLKEQEGVLDSGSGNTGEPQDELVNVDVTFSVIGTYEQFKSLLRMIEQSLLLLEVTEIGFTSVKEGSFLQFQITVRAYSIPSN